MRRSAAQRSPLDRAREALDEGAPDRALSALHGAAPTPTAQALRAAAHLALEAPWRAQAALDAIPAGAPRCAETVAVEVPARVALGAAPERLRELAGQAGQPMVAAEAWLAGGRPAAADAALAGAGDDPEAACLRALARLDQGDARGALTVVSPHLPGDAGGVWEVAALAAVALGRPQDALAALDRAARPETPPPPSALVRARVAALVERLRGARPPAPPVAAPVAGPPVVSVLVPGPPADRAAVAAALVGQTVAAEVCGPGDAPAGRVLLRLAPGLRLPPDLLARHAAAHAPAGPPAVVVQPPRAAHPGPLSALAAARSAGALVTPGDALAPILAVPVGASVPAAAFAALPGAPALDRLGLARAVAAGWPLRDLPGAPPVDLHPLGPARLAARARAAGAFEQRLEGLPADEAARLQLRATAESLAAEAQAAGARLAREAARTPPVAASGLRRRQEALVADLQAWLRAHRAAGRAAVTVDRPRPPGPPRVDQLTSVILLNLNGLPHVCEAVASLRRSTDGPVQLIVVDNGSTDGSLAWLQAQPDLEVVALPENVGAPEGRNRGLARARGEVLVFADNDVVFTRGWRARLLAHFEPWPDVGAVGPMSDEVMGPQRVAPPPPGADLDDWAAAFAQQRAGGHTWCQRLILFCMAVRREVVEQLGGFDPRYGLWGFEDDDYSARMRRAGWRLRVAGDCFIRHLGSQTSRAADLDYASLLDANWAIFKERWGLPPALPYGAPYDLDAQVARGFDPAQDRVAVALPPADPAQAVRLACGA